MTSSTAAAAAAAGRNGFGLHHPQPAHSPKPATPAPAPETAPSAHTEDSAHPHRTAAAGSLHRQHPSNPSASSSAPPTAPPTAPIASAPAPAAVPESQTANPTAPASTSASTSASTPAPSTSAHPPPPSTPPPPFRSAVAAMAADHQAGASDAQPASTTADGAPSADHAMPDAPALEGFDATPRPAEPQPQATPVQQQLHLHHDTAMAAPDHFAPSTPFTPAAMPNLDQHAYMMMALASMSGAPSAMSPPPTVTPSQVTLPNPMDEAFHGLAPANAIRQAGADKALESFARVEFADSVFQMTTYAVIIGRDQRALEQARRDEKRADEHRRRVEDNANRGLPPPSPIAYERGKFSKSYVSEEGGMLGPESDNGENGRPAKRRKTSTQGSSQNENDEAQQAQENMISNRQYVSHTPGAAAVDLTSLRPSPWHVPFIGIHSPGPNIATKTKAISREHLKIAYNQEEGVFEAIPLHKNGFFCEDVHYKSEKVVLKCGDRLQIKDIDFRFLINGVERGCTGAEDDVEEITPTTKKRTHGGKEMSFDFESSHGNGEVRDTSDELSEVASPPELSDFGDGDADADAEGDPEVDPEEDAEVDAEGDVDGDGEEEEIEEADVVETVEAELERPSLDPEGRVKHELIPQPHPLIPQIPKKRGPGRPPKNGIMSKREQRLLKKQQQEMAKKTLPQAPPVEPPIKRKVGRPRKHPLPENSSERPEKRKYKPRKPKNEDGAEGSDAERRAREKKEKKARPKSPPLELKIEDYTEEQLQKPNKNYGVLIDETLTAAGPDGLTLKQIYKRICQRYPWFYFHTETKGWESSVRHNLIGNEAFKKDETTNLWSRVPGVELDAGKKRKASSPDRGLAAAQAYGQYPYPYNAAQHIPPGAPGYHPPGQAPPVYQVPAYNAQQGQPGRPVQPYGASASPPGQPVLPVASQPPAPAQLPGYGPPPAPARPQLGAPQPGAYSSPYARPPPSATPPIKNEDGHAPAAVPPAQQPAAAPIAPKTIPGPVSISQHPVAPVAAVAPIAAVAPVAPVAAAPSRPAATPTPTTPARPVIEPRLLTAVVGLKNGLVENLKKARNPKAEAIVMSALNRCIGLKKEATENDKMETICMKGIRQVIDGFTKTKSPTPGAGPSSSETPPIFEAKVLASLTGFKDVSIKALKAKLGESKAEAVTLSAIDRVLGLADASIVPPPAEGEPSVGNFEGVEQHLIKSIRQLLTGMNQKLQGVGA